MRISLFGAAICIALLSPAVPVQAHHPGTDLDEVMGNREDFFQAIDQPAPGFELADAQGRPVGLSGFEGKIVILNFIYAGCLDVCPLHSELISEVQRLLNESPMKTMVQFVSITTDPGNDTPEVMRGYGEAHGLDPVNWVFLTKPSDQPENATRTLARAYGLEFTETEDGQQMHGVVTHVIDRDGRLAAKFHGLRFKPVNLILYVNGLINNAGASGPPREKSWWDWMAGWF